MEQKSRLVRAWDLLLGLLKQREDSPTGCSEGVKKPSARDRPFWELVGGEQARRGKIQGSKQETSPQRAAEHLQAHLQCILHQCPLHPARGREAVQPTASPTRALRCPGAKQTEAARKSARAAHFFAAAAIRRGASTWAASWWDNSCACSRHTGAGPANAEGQTHSQSWRFQQQEEQSCHKGKLSHMAELP